MSKNNSVKYNLTISMKLNLSSMLRLNLDECFY